MKPKGRPPIAKDGEKMRNRNFRATDAEWEKCLSLGGGSFLRAKINAAKVKDAVQSLTALECDAGAAAIRKLSDEARF